MQIARQVMLMESRKKWFTVYFDSGTSNTRIYLLDSRCRIFYWRKKMCIRDRTLADHGAAVIPASRNKENGKKVVGEIEAMGRESLLTSVDSTKEADLTRLRDEVIQKFGKIDILVNSQGVEQRGYIKDYKFEDWRKVMSVKMCIRDSFTVTNIFNLLRQLVPMTLATLGMLLVVLTGGIDLSVGSVTAMGGMITAIMIENAGMVSGGSMIVILIAVLGIGFLIGCMSGCLLYTSRCV